MKRPIVCGGRQGVDPLDVFLELHKLHRTHGFQCIIHGNARGVDSDAREWAKLNKVLHAPFRADWDRHGKAAGPMRNQRMIDEGNPDGCIAFPGGKGTADMVTRARKAGLEVIEIGRKETQPVRPREVNTSPTPIQAKE